METILSLDLGTTYFKAALFDRRMRLLAIERLPVELQLSTSGWREIPGEMFHRLLRRLSASLRAQCPEDYARVAAITFSTQTNSFLLLDGQDRPLTPIILWSDPRAENDFEILEHLDKLPNRARTTGLPELSHHLMLAKIGWLRRHTPAIIAVTRRVCLISDYLTLLLTGKHVTESGAAGLTGLLDVHLARWWPEACEAAQVPAHWLPRVVRAGTDLGPINQATSDAWQLPRSCRLIVGCLDQYAGAIGAGNHAPGNVSETTGTVLATVRCAPSFATDAQRICQGPSFEPGWYWQMIFSNHGASLLEAFRNAQPDRPDFATLDAEAESVSPGADGLRLARDLGSDPMSAFVGLNSHHTRGHKARCIMEAVAFCLADQIEALCGTKQPAQVTCCGGGARSKTWMQIKADVLNSPCAPSSSPEPACFGAALLAARAMKWCGSNDWPSVSNHAELIRPRPEVHKIYEAMRPALPE